MPASYDISRKSLFTPCADAAFFIDGVPASKARLCAEMARLAYCPRDKIDAVLRAHGFNAATHFEYRSTLIDTQGFLAGRADGAQRVLAFRGTEASSGADILTDLDARLDVWDGTGQVHRGFSDALKKIWPNVEAGLPAGLGNLLITGHSLGAALATLAAGLLGGGELFTYGSPRVGDQAFVDALVEAGIPSHRYVHCADLVCQIPPELIGYRHYGPAIYIDRDGVQHTDWSDAQKLQDQSVASAEYIARHAWKIGSVPVRNLADHTPINYVNVL